MIRACSQMQQACCSSLNRDQYRSLIGFLEHVRAVLFLRGDKMYGLYDALGWDLEPADLVVCNDLMHQQFQRMMSRVMVQAGTSVEHLPAFISGQPLPKIQKELPARRIVLFSDAAKEGTTNPGLGGWVLGFTWTVPLSKLRLQLDIPILEAVAAVVNIVFAFNLMGGTGHLPAGACFEAHVDAQATAHVLIRGKARSKMMQFVHTLALQCEGFKQMLPFLIVSHCFGLGNVASDAASRGYGKILRVIAQALDVRLIEAPAPEMAIWMLDQCLEHASKLKHEFRWGCRGVVIGQAKVPGPMFQPMQSNVPLDSSCEVPTRQQQQRTGGKRQRCFQPLESQIDSIHPKRGDAAVEAELTFQPELNRSARVGPFNPRKRASLLWADKNEHAICVGDWDQLLQCCDVALSTAGSGDASAQRTAEADVRHWKIWSEYCEIIGTDPFQAAG